jgi:predicted acyltransferase
VGYWLAFALYPLPGADFNWSQAGVKPDWAHNLTGLAAHWNKNTNFAWAVDTWFMNLFPREHAFTNNGGGYSTLSFIPTLGTMILGLLAGGVLRSGRTSMGKVRWLAAAGIIGLGTSLLLAALGLCPIVKRIWTPSWVLYSGGWCFLWLAGLYLVMDVWQRRSWAFPLVVVGMNSIAAYLIAHLFVEFISKALPRHLGRQFFATLGQAYEPFLLGASVLLIEWLLLWWMYRRKLFLRV